MTSSKKNNAWQNFLRDLRIAARQGQIEELKKKKRNASPSRAATIQRKISSLQRHKPNSPF
jgi:hypothetical protein